jgi:hypothetical protein
MSASLGATTYTSVTWTAGDTITEAKMDNMVANDQAYDSHASQGLLLDNNKSFAGKTTAVANRNLIKMNSSDNIEIGDSDLTGEVQMTKNVVKTIQVYQDIVTATDGSTVTFDLSNGNVQKVTLGGNRILAISNAKVGQSFILRLIQDGTGSRTVTWFSTINWDNGTVPTLTTTGGKTDVFGFLVTASGTYDGYVLGQNI